MQESSAPKTFVPLATNRFVINVVGTDIPYYLFKSYRMYNQDKTIVIDTEFYETNEWTFNPQEFFDIEDLLIQNLDVTGQVISTLDFSVKEIFYEKYCSYSDNGFMINKLKFITDNCVVINSKDLDKEEETEKQ